MTIIKTLLLQVFMLLAVIGSVQGQAEKPSLTAEVDGAPVGNNYVVKGKKCKKSLKLICTTTTLTEFMAFEKDGAVQGEWEDETSTGVIYKETQALGVDAKIYGKWKCLGATDNKGAGKSEPSEHFLQVDCLDCILDKSCTENPTIGDHSHCTSTTQGAGICECKYAGNLGDCKECNTTNAGCEATSKAPRCVAGKCTKCDIGSNAPCKTDEKCQSTGECKATPPTTASAGTTSMAGTVTSTACLVIASIVVALMI